MVGKRRRAGRGVTTLLCDQVWTCVGKDRYINYRIMCETDYKEE